MIDILNIQPHQVSRDLSGYTIMFYGAPKTGKTTIASRFEKTLVIAFEQGYKAIPGIMAAPVTSWSDFKKIIKQLKTEEAHRMYKNITVDTADIAYDLCEKYICAQNGVDSIKEVPYGQGWTQAKREFDECLRAITMMDYGLILISHSQDKTFTDENGNEYNQIVPTLSNGPRLIVDRMADILGYAAPVQNEDGSTKTILYMRGTPRFVAGSRFAYTPDSIEFTYENLVKAVNDAIDKQGEVSGTESITDAKFNAPAESNLDFKTLMNEFQSLVSKLQEKAGSNEVFGSEYAPKITEITSKYLGKGRKVSDCTPDQAEQLSLIVDDLKDLAA